MTRLSWKIPLKRHFTSFYQTSGQRPKHTCGSRTTAACSSAIATLQAPLDKFFTSVMVMVDDEKLRDNRLALLANLAALVKQVADLSKIVVARKAPSSDKHGATVDCCIPSVTRGRFSCHVLL